MIEGLEHLYTKDEKPKTPIPPETVFYIIIGVLLIGLGVGLSIHGSSWLEVDL